MTDDRPVLSHDVPAERGVVRVFTMNRPRQRNAMNTETFQELLEGLVTADRDPEIRVIVLTGAGGHFSAGGDVKEFAADDDPQLKVTRARMLGDLLLLPRRLNTPLIAAAPGVTVGGGAALALAADMLIAGDDLAFGFPELARSISPTMVMVGLGRQVGSRFAFELLSTGRFLDAQEALSHRIVNRVVPSDRLLDVTIDLALSLAAIEPAALRTMKQQFYLGQDLTDAAAMKVGIDLQADRWVPSEP